MSTLSKRDLLALVVITAAVSVATPMTVRHSIAPVVDVATTAVNSVAEAPMAAIETPMQLASEVAGSHLGFDTNIYPGDGTMRVWRSVGRYEWVGYYLPAPCHKDGSWSGNRQQLTDMGWGLAVIYVGQQQWERRRSRSARARKTNTSCSTSFLSAAQGRAEADDAIRTSQREGFANGSVIFLDVERVETMSQPMRAYYRSWIARVLADGRYRPGIYAHTHNAERIYADARAVYDAAGVAAEPPFWIANTRDFSPNKLPSEVGHTFAAMWQGIIDKFERNGGIRLPIDVSVSSYSSPSSHQNAD